MRIQESLVTDKQIALELFSENGRYRLPIEGKDYYFPTLKKVHEAFLNQDTYDTIRLTHNGKKSYLHFFMDEIEVFDTKKALRKRLSQDSQGMWAEIRNGNTHYYVEKRGWISTSYKEITEKECIEKLQHTSTMTKVLGIGLGMLALLPGAVEFARHLPISTKEAAMGLIALNQKSPVLGAIGYSLLPSKAEAQAVGTEFQVNTYTTNDQSTPSVAPQNDGGFVVTWVSNGQDGDSYGIYGQRYDRNGMTAGAEFQVNTYTTSYQLHPSIAPLNDGGFVITWASNGQDGDSYGIYGQRYDRNGMAAGTEFQINTYTTNSQTIPSVAPLNDGGFIVTWASNGQDGLTYDIYGQKFDSSGVAVGSEFQINTYTADSQNFPSIAPLNDGGFVVAWESYAQDGSLNGIYGQRYDSNGVATGAEFQVNTYTTSFQQSPTVAPLNDGGFVVIWHSNGQDGDLSGIYGQRYENSGAVAGSEFKVNTYFTSDQNYPSVAPLNDGGFVVAWQSTLQDGSQSGIYGQRYDSSGVATGSEFQINTYTSSLQLNPSVAPLNDGGFLVTWQSYLQDGDHYGIFGQRYDASGNPIGLQISTSMTVTPISNTTQPAPSQTTAFLTGQSALTSPTAAPSPTPVIASNPLPSTTPPDSKIQTALSIQPSQTATSASLPIRPTSSAPTIVSMEDIVYGQSYPIQVNDQIVGTYSISEGTAVLDSNNPIVIFLEFDPSFQPEVGEVITLFTIPEEDIALWESIQIEGESIECLEPHGYVNTKVQGSSFQIIFEEATCLNMASTIIASALPLTLN